MDVGICNMYMLLVNIMGVLFYIKIWALHIEKKKIAQPGVAIIVIGANVSSTFTLA